MLKYVETVLGHKQKTHQFEIAALIAHMQMETLKTEKATKLKPSRSLALSPILPSCLLFSSVGWISYLSHVTVIPFHASVFFFITMGQMEGKYFGASTSCLVELSLDSFVMATSTWGLFQLAKT
jgi:hypothetical protein